MVYQFLYGRKKAGYCQINDDIMPFNKNELLKIEGLKTYSIAEGMNTNDLPQAFYYYNEVMDNKCVGILGKTVFVPGGKSEESGSRDTCFLHAYILDGNEYLSAINSPAELFRDRMYYESVEEYLQKGISSYEQQVGGKTVNFMDVIEAFCLDPAKLRDFIRGCLNVFSDSGKRVYCYLPSNDKNGSEYAKKLMDVIFSVLPPSIILGAGFITYSSSFHNPASNPIPGNIGVVFIPDTAENRMQAKYESNRNYVFDFKNYSTTVEPAAIEFIYNIVDIMINKILGIPKPQMFDLDRFYAELKQSIKPMCQIDSKFLGAYSLICMLWDKIVENVPEMKNKSENYQLSREDSLVIQSHINLFLQKVKMTAAGSIYDILKYQTILTSYAKTKIYNILYTMLTIAEYDQNDLIWIDKIYSGGDLYRQVIIQRLCEQCLYLAEHPSDTKKIIDITNYMYTNEDINDKVIDLIYRERRYFPVAQKLIETTLTPLINNNKLNLHEKLEKIFNSVKVFYNQYPELVLDNSFKCEIKKVVEDIIPLPYTYENISDLVNIIFNLKSVLQTAFQDILQNSCYQLIVSIVNDTPDTSIISYQQKLDIYEWSKSVNLFDYDKLPDYMAVNTLKIFNGRLKRTRIGQSIKEKNISEISQILSTCSSIELNRICSEMEESIITLINQYRKNADNRREYNALFQELFKSDVRSIPKEVALNILKEEGLSGLRSFYENFLSSISDKEYEYKSINFMKQAIRNYINYANTDIEYSEDDKYFLKSLDLYPYIREKMLSSSNYRAESQRRMYAAKEEIFRNNKEQDHLSHRLKNTVNEMLSEDEYNTGINKRKPIEKNLDSADNKKNKFWPFGNK